MRPLRILTLAFLLFTLTAAGYIKRMPVSTYRAQKRGGKGVSAQSLREEDYVDALFTASSHDNILFFTSSGRVYKKKGYQIPEASRTAKGTHLNNIFQFEPGERVTAMLHGRDYDESGYLFMVTRNGTVKRTEKSAFRNIRAAGLRGLTLDEGDELIAVLETDGEANVLIATHDGMAICFNENDVRPMGRDAAGVRGIKLDEGDYAEKLTAILRENDIQSVTVARMEVPCCGGIENAVKRALQQSGKFIPWRVAVISTDGRILSD